MTSLSFSFKLAVAELKPWLPRAALLSGLFVLLGVLLELKAGPAFAVDRALLGTTFGLAVPLLAFFGSRHLFLQGINQTLVPLTRYGACRRLALLGSSLGLALVIIGTTLGLAWLTLVFRAQRPDFAHDLLTTSGIALQAGLAYTALFLLGTSLGNRGPLVLLLLDWFLGATGGAVALPWPRAHIRALLGGAPVFELEQSMSSIVLLCLVVMYAGFVRLRTAA